MAGKADIVNNLASNVDGLTKKQAGEALDAVFSFIASSLAADERVQIAGFGTFVKSFRKERQGRNPKTNQPMTIPASNSVRFKAGKQLKDAVN